MNLIDHFGLICSQWGGGELADVTTVVARKIIQSLYLQYLQLRNCETRSSALPGPPIYVSHFFTVIFPEEAWSSS